MSDELLAKIASLEAECDRWAEASIVEDSRRAKWRSALQKITDCDNPEQMRRWAREALSP